MDEFAGTGNIFDFTSLQTIADLSFTNWANRACLLTTICREIIRLFQFESQAVAIANCVNLFMTDQNSGAAQCNRLVEIGLNI